MILQDMKWTREPAEYSIHSDKIEITTMPHTDLWQQTYYHFRNDNAPVLQFETGEQFFSFIVRTDFSESHHRFDQCGIVSAGDKMIIASNAPGTVKISLRCVYAICGKVTAGSVSVYMPAVRRIRNSEQFLQI